MCGILGGVNARFTDESLRRLDHRGPDQRALHFLPHRMAGAITLGQTRLNIVDRDDIDLPVRHGDAYILFNGEIYNYPELRDELRQLGWEFATRTDAEVALVAYRQWGAECLRRFNGMFALAIWDGARFFCGRDRMGKKPLYYRLGPGVFEFASEIKALPDLEFVTHELFDLFEFCFNEHTLYRDVLALRPGQYLIYDLDKGMCATTTYWDIEQSIGEGCMTDERAAVDSFIDLLRDAVRLRLRADVPVTLFLAGGMDSSLIAALSGVKEAFTCQFEEFRGTIDEEGYVLDLARRLGIDAHLVRPTRDEFFRDLAQMSYHLEMPTGSFSVFPLYRLAEAVRRHRYKVVLSGEGSDELFAGYVRNELLMDDPGGATTDKRRHYSAMLSRFHGSEVDRFCRMASRSGLVGAALMRTFLSGYWSPRRTFLGNIAYVESRIFLQPLLQMADRMCMAHGVENRCPFLDYRIVEFAFSLDDSLRYRDGVGKWIVHRAAEKVLPKGARVLQRKIKHGLPTPVNQWLYGSPGFDRRHWNALMTAECIKSLLSLQGRSTAPRSVQAHAPRIPLQQTCPAFTALVPAGVSSE
jgi:asparagine synthase (glutamine-hydrolysing)